MKKVLATILILSLVLLGPINYHDSTAEAATIMMITNATPRYSIYKGDKLKLTVNTKKAVSWSSSDKTIVSVSKKGVAKGKGGGTATITASVNGKKYKCKIKVLLTDVDLQYLRDKAERDYIDNFEPNKPEPDTEYTYGSDETEKDKNDDTLKRISAMMKYGFSNSEDYESEIGQAYIKFCDKWVSEYELNNSYKIETVWSAYNKKLYLIKANSDKYIINFDADNFFSDTIYTNGEIHYQFISKFVYKDKFILQQQYFFSREDLKAKGIIK